MQEVYQRLLATDKATPSKTLTEKFIWPPKVSLEAEEIVNAFAWLEADERGRIKREAKTGKSYPAVVIFKGLMSDIVQGEPDRLALILGHELAHILLGHVLMVGLPGSSQPGLIKSAYRREQELAADRLAMELVVAAGYSYRTARQVWRRFNDDDFRQKHPAFQFSSFEGLRQDHPAWTERLALLDKEQENLWRAMSAFENGVLFLAVEQYEVAEFSFRVVVKDFPGAWEAWSNLGYAQLMRYCDALELSDLKRFGIGHIMTEGFYRRPKALEELVRGINEERWFEAVGALREALRLKEALGLSDPMTLTKAALGIAYLVRPVGKEVGQALKFLEEALASAESDERLTPASRASVLINAAVAGLASDKNPAELLEKANQIAQVSPVVGAVVSYNRALLLARSAQPNGRKTAAGELEQYLREASPASLWWELGYEQYLQLCQAEKIPPQSREALLSGQQPFLRPVISVDFGVGKLVTLSDRLTDVKARLGPAETLPIIAGTNLVRLKYAQYGADILASEQVLAILLHGAGAPAVTIKGLGLATRETKLRIGMPQQELEGILGAPHSSVELIDPRVRYRLYSQAGLAVAFANGKVSEVVIVQVPVL